MNKSTNWVPTNTFGMRVHQLRHACGLSAAELGEITGNAETTVLNWEKGSAPKNQAEIVDKIARATGVDRNWLMWGEMPNEPVNPGQNEVQRVVAGAGFEPATSRLHPAHNSMHNSVLSVSAA